MEGWDFYTTNQTNQRGWSGTLHALTTGRFGGQALLSGGSGQGQYIKPFPSSYGTLTMGLAFQFGNNLTLQDLLVIRAAGTSAVKLGLTAGNILSVRNSGNTVIATGSTILTSNTWYYAEIKAFINGASGTCEVHLNGISASPEITSTTGNFGSTNLDSVMVHPSTNTYTTDDYYACDTSGSTNTGFLGDVRVATLAPSGAGSHAQFTPLSGANYQNVDDATPDDDTTYNYDANPGDIDSFPTAGVPSGATVYGVQENVYARKDDVGARQIAPLVRQGGTDYPGTAAALSAQYIYYSQIYNQDPTGSNWTAANLNADEFGYKMVA